MEYRNARSVRIEVELEGGDKQVVEGTVNGDTHEVQLIAWSSGSNAHLSAQGRRDVTGILEQALSRYKPVEYHLSID